MGEKIIVYYNETAALNFGDRYPNGSSCNEVRGIAIFQISVHHLHVVASLFPNIFVTFRNKCKVLKLCWPTHLSIWRPAHELLGTPTELVQERSVC